MNTEMPNYSNKFTAPVLVEKLFGLSDTYKQSNLNEVQRLLRDKGGGEMPNALLESLDFAELDWWKMIGEDAEDPYFYWY